MADFIIQEIPPFEAEGRRLGERFVWSAEKRSAPEKPLPNPGSLRHRRTDRAGGIEPTFQILGPKIEPVLIRGVFNDRWNSVGYAKAERTRLLGVCYRGNRVRISFDDVEIVGHIVHWDFPYFDDWRIGYELTVEVSRDAVIESARDRRSAAAIPSPSAIARELRASVDATLLAADEAPRQVVVLDAVALVDEDLAAIDAPATELATANDLRLAQGEAADQSALREMADALRRARLAALAATDRLVEFRADTELQYRTAMGELQFEVWARDTAYQARLLAFDAWQNEIELRRVAEPDPIRLYEPRAGESLYAVSLAMYGTPHHWRAIADRNNLDTFVCAGDEILVIPDTPAIST